MNRARFIAAAVSFVLASTAKVAVDSWRDLRKRGASMIYGLSSAPVPASLPYAGAVNAACLELQFPPCLAYGIANRETIRGERNGLWNAATIISSDGGHGLFQLTSYVPPGWNNPSVNAYAAVIGWLRKDAQFWNASHGFRDMTLAKAVAASFNAGRDAVLTVVGTGKQIDSVTTGGDYAADVWACYQSLLANGEPT